MKFIQFVSLLIVVLSSISCKQRKGAFLGEEPPGMKAKLFAPGKISKEDRYEYGSYFSNDGKEFYYAVIVNENPQIWAMQLIDDEWAEPKVVLANDMYEYNDPFLSPDGKRLFFISNQPLDGQGVAKDFDIWYVERQNGGWSKPINSGTAINTDKNEYFMSFTASGTMYFSSNGEGTGDNDYNIYFTKFSDGQFEPRQRLGETVNSEFYEADVFVSPDEKYVIYCGEKPDGLGEGDLYISFKGENGQWQKSKNMGSVINTEKYEFCPFVTRDGKYLFFSREGDIYWISAAIINTFQ